MNKNNKLFMGLEENLVLIPLLLSILFVLGGFLAQLFAGKDAASTVFFIQASYYAFAWYVCIACSCCVRDRMYLNVDAVSKLWPAKVRFVIAILNEIFELIVIVILFIFSFVIAKEAVAAKLTNPQAPALYVSISYFAPIIGFGLSLFRQIERLIKEGIKA